MRNWCSGIWVLLLVLFAVPGAASADLLAGDLTGDGSVDARRALAAGRLRRQQADPEFEPAADLNGDGAVDHRDLGLFGGSFGTSGGEVDLTPPALSSH